MKKNVILLILIIGFTGCRDKKIEITVDYIINANWNEQANAITVNKLKLIKDSTINPLTDLNQVELLEKLEDDSSFLFTGNVKYNGEKYSARKVFFDKKDNFFWFSNEWETKKETIGRLQKNTWYKFSDLVTYPFFVYVYVDSTNNVHRFNVNLANY